MGRAKNARKRVAAEPPTRGGVAREIGMGFIGPALGRRSARARSARAELRESERKRGANRAGRRGEGPFIGGRLELRAKRCGVDWMPATVKR
jgi:hypothetical protein